MAPTSCQAEPLTDTYLLLAGQYSWPEFIKFMKFRALPESWGDEGALRQRWEAARCRLGQQKSTSGETFERPAWEPPSDEFLALAEREERRCAGRTSARARHGLPRRWAWVDLDRVIVWQRHVNCTFAAEVTARIGDSPTDADLISIAMGTHWPPTPVAAVRVAENAFTFSSSSADLRFLEIAPLDPSMASITGEGVPTHVIGVSVGFGPNLITALECGDRLVLKNGTHRAYALRQAGIRRVPCLVETLPREHALGLLDDSELRQSVALQLAGARPALFRDYFDEQLTMAVRVRRAEQLLLVQVNVQSLKSATHETRYRTVSTGA